MFCVDGGGERRPAYRHGRRDVQTASETSIWKNEGEPLTAANISNTDKLDSQLSYTEEDNEQGILCHGRKL